ncbi:MAG: hypothetical protein GY831_24935, partial [Delftia sp.]|nr:hypothetical protein [Delftia sp.]
ATQGTDGLLVQVAITNSGAGHHVPTDSPLRNLILLVQARDEQGRMLDYVGRQVVPDWGGVGDPAQGNYAGQPGKGFAKVLQDADGNAPAPQWRSTEIIYDNRIAALATDVSHYAFAAPAGGQAEVQATLIFRRAFKAWAEQKGWDTPDIVMAQDSRRAVVINQPALVGLGPRYDVNLFAPSPATTGDGQRLRPADLPPAETCAECHADQHAAWQAAAHGQAGGNPAYQGWLLAAIQSTENRMTRFCAACHTPGGMLVGQVRVERNWRGFFLRPFGDVAREGVSCSFCHSLTATTGLGDGAYVSDPLAPLPAGQDVGPHERTYSRDWYASAEFCATCHQAQHPDNGLPLMTTYSEWRDSPYNSGDPATAHACQACHGDGHDGVSQEQLESAAQVQVLGPATVQPGQASLRVEVRNVGAGHALPTGATELC